MLEYIKYVNERVWEKFLGTITNCLVIEIRYISIVLTALILNDISYDA